MDAVVRFFKEGGLWLVPIAFVSFLVLAIAIERVIFVVFRFNLNGAAFMAQIQKLVMANNIDRAIKLCNAAPHAALPKVIKAGLTRANKGELEIQNAIEEATLEVMPPLTKSSGSLATLASLSTLLGLLGTVMGLIGAFRAVAKADPAQKSQILTEFIAEAMNCTAFGLIVAIPALVAFSLLQGRTQHMVDDINETTVGVLNLIMQNREKMKLPQA